MPQRSACTRSRTREVPIDLLRIVVDLDPPLTVALHGELDMDTAPRLTAALELLPRGPTIVDATELRFIDSSGIGALALAWRQGREITVVGADGGVRRAFEITGFGDWLT